MRRGDASPSSNSTAGADTSMSPIALGHSPAPAPNATSLHLGSWSRSRLEVEELRSQLHETTAALSKHKESLVVALKEVTTLKSVVKALEGTVQELQIERNSLLDELRVSKSTEEELLGQIHSLTATCERLTEWMQQAGVENAHRLTSIETLKREQETSLKHDIERLTAQLLSTQHPTNAARPIPWSKIAAIDGHPAHILREVVTADARREDRMMRTMLDTLAAPDDESLARLLRCGTQASSTPGGNIALPGSAKVSEDEMAWRNVCRRIYQVLLDRRKLLGVEDDSPLEFLLRTRHEMASELIHQHEEVKRIAMMITALGQKIDMVSSLSVSNNNNNSASNSGRPGAAPGTALTSGYGALQVLEGQLEIVSTAIADMDYALSRIITACFTDVDRALLIAKPTSTTSGKDSKRSTAAAASKSTGAGGVSSKTSKENIITPVFGSEGSPKRTGSRFDPLL